MGNQYSYRELREAAVKDPTPENLAALGEWLQIYGDSCWCGDRWAIGASGRDSDDSLCLRPIYGPEPDEHDIFPLLGYEFS